MGGMFHALLTCSDEDCTETFDAWASSIEELETLACDCGCALTMLWVDEADDSRMTELELMPLG